MRVQACHNMDLNHTMVVQIMRYKVAAVGISDIGRVRQNNEDVWAQLPDFQFYVVADGMGGHQAGEIASREAVNTFCALIKDMNEDLEVSIGLQELRRNISWIIEEVNASVYKMGRADQELRGMGTTLCCLYFHRDGVVYGHVGDSRIYRLRQGRLSQLTKDHSLLRQLIDMGQVSEQKAPEFMYKNIITKAIGTEASVDPSVYTAHIEVGDIYMMCTDGLSDLLTTKEMEEIINQADSLQQATQKLVDSANEIGGHDNITVVIAKVLPLDESPDLLRQ